MVCKNLKEKAIIARLGKLRDINHFLLFKNTTFHRMVATTDYKKHHYFIWHTERKTLPSLNHDSPSTLRFMLISNKFKCEINVHPKAGGIWHCCFFFRWLLLGGFQRNSGRIEEGQNNFFFLSCFLFPILFIIPLATLLLNPGSAYCTCSSNCFEYAGL